MNKANIKKEFDKNTNKYRIRIIEESPLDEKNLYKILFEVFDKTIKIYLSQSNNSNNEKLDVYVKGISTQELIVALQKYENKLEEKISSLNLYSEVIDVSFGIGAIGILSSLIGRYFFNVHSTYEQIFFYITIGSMLLKVFLNIKRNKIQKKIETLKKLNFKADENIK
ncbi:MAG: hypothetical protein QW678_01470 [Candidatus Aenigmatarchaeota archaeon]